MVALLNQSTTTKRESKPKDIGRSVMKYMVTEDQIASGTGFGCKYLDSWLILGSLTYGATFYEFVDKRRHSRPPVISRDQFVGLSSTRVSCG